MANATNAKSKAAELIEPGINPDTKDTLQQQTYWLSQNIQLKVNNEVR